ncbi:MAG: metal-dependent hydrolase, partial [Burkholderiaceae bacterium]|nr:metal-dependent hydrolase [Burkholderiaceae bacterium]
MPIPSLKYLGGYPPDLLDRVQRLIDDGGLAQTLGRRYPDAHSVRTDRALYDYVSALKSEFMRNADPLDKVVFDGRLHVIRNALGTHTTVWR